MNLGDVVNQLKASELSQLAIGGESPGEYTMDNIGVVADLVNAGLTALYKRFNLKESSFDLELIPGKTDYLLNSKYAESNANSFEPDRYIKDSSVDPFKDNLLKILKVITEDGRELKLNEGRESIKTPSLNTLIIPQAFSNNYRYDFLTIYYKANHPRLVPEIGYWPPEEVEIELPESHLMALCYFIASRAYNPTGMENEFHAGNSYYAKYEAECARLMHDGMYQDNFHDTNPIYRDGWV